MAKDDVIRDWDELILQGLSYPFPLDVIPCSCQLPLHALSWPWGFPNPSVSRLSSLTQRGKMHVCVISSPLPFFFFFGSRLVPAALWAGKFAET